MQDVVLYHCAKSANCPLDRAGECRYAKPHEHGAHVGLVRLWCAVPQGKTEMIDCVAVGKTTPLDALAASVRHDQAKSLQPDRGAA